MIRHTDPSPEQDRLVQSIYDAVDDPIGVGAVLGDLAAHVGAGTGQTFVTANGTDLVEHRFLGPTPGAWDDYLFHWRQQDPRFAAALARPGVVLTDTEDIDRAAFEASAIFNEALTRDGTYYALFGNFPVGDDLLLSQALLRDHRAGPFARREVERLTRLMPHLRRMTRLRHLVQSMRHELDDLRRALDVVPSAVAILDPSGKVLCANAAAEALFRRRGGLRTEGGKLTAASASETRELAATIAKTALLADAAEKRPVSAALASTTPVAIAREDAAPLSVGLHPLRPRSAIRHTASRAARVLAIIHDPETRIRLKPAIVAKVHGLTATEALVAAALAEGHTLAEFANVHGCTEQTARVHLKRILDKTGTKRQADLVRALLTGVALHSLD